MTLWQGGARKNRKFHARMTGITPLACEFERFRNDLMHVQVAICPQSSKERNLLLASRKRHVVLQDFQIPVHPFWIIRFILITGFLTIFGKNDRLLVVLPGHVDRKSTRLN